MQSRSGSSGINTECQTKYFPCLRLTILSGAWFDARQEMDAWRNRFLQGNSIGHKSNGVENWTMGPMSRMGTWEKSSRYRAVRPIFDRFTS